MESYRRATNSLPQPCLSRWTDHNTPLPPRASRSSRVERLQLLSKEATDSLDNFGNLKEHSQHLQLPTANGNNINTETEARRPSPHSEIYLVLPPVSAEPSVWAVTHCLCQGCVSEMRRPHPLSAQVAGSSLGHRASPNYKMLHVYATLASAKPPGLP